MQMIYMDNASTSYPKAPGVGAAMARYVERLGVNVRRGGYASALEVEDASLTLRERLCAAFGSRCPEACILTPGATLGLNMALKGCLKPGDHVLVSSVEHNAVMRPLSQLAAQGVTVEQAPCRADGTLDPAELESRIRPNTRLACVTHASNVCGTLLPVAALGAVCRRHGVDFVVDASQTAGHVPLDCEAMQIDALVFSAHKGLLGPQGIGAALLTRAFAEKLSPFVTGGTGSRSDQEAQPAFLPDKLEAGTPNLPGMYGFLAALDFWEPRFTEIREREAALCRRMLNGLREAAEEAEAKAGGPLLRIPGPRGGEGRVGVISIDFATLDNAEMAVRLEREYGVLTRCGLHCAPSAHRTLGTFPAGTVRFSIGWATVARDVDEAMQAVRALLGLRG